MLLLFNPQYERTTGFQGTLRALRYKKHYRWIAKAAMNRKGRNKTEK